VRSQQSIGRPLADVSYSTSPSLPMRWNLHNMQAQIENRTTPRQQAFNEMLTVRNQLALNATLWNKNPYSSQSVLEFERIPPAQNHKPNTDTMRIITLNKNLCMLLEGTFRVRYGSHRGLPHTRKRRTTAGRSMTKLPKEKNNTT
jgi:hypothetical protein